MKAHQRVTNGFAIAATLMVIVLLTILVIGLLDTMRLDRTAAYSNIEGTRAELAAERGVEDVASALWKYTTDSSRLWVSQPGQLIVGAQQDDSKTSVNEKKVLTNYVSLSSSISTVTSSGIFAPAALNIPILTGSGNQYTVSNGDGSTAPPSMNLKWTYLRSDGTIDPSETPDLSNQSNPLIARYAYWTDDESTKINVNTAWKRDQTGETASFPENHPSHIDLSAIGLSGTAMGAIHNYVFGATPGIAFNSASEAKRVAVALSDPTMPSAIDANKFGITHFNSSQPYVSDPIYLTTDYKLMTSLKAKGLIAKVQDATAVSSLVTPNFIDILSSPELDPGYLPNLDPNRLNKVIATIRAQLLRTDWPLTPGSDLIAKWFPSLTGNDKVFAADQVALNIIDYVRLKESKLKVVVPIVATRSSSGNYTFTSYMRGNENPVYFGATNVSISAGTQTNDSNSKWLMGGRCPVITEMTMVIDPNPVAKPSAVGNYWPKVAIDPSSPNNRQSKQAYALLYRCKVYVELYLPKFEGLDSNFQIDFTQMGSSAWPDVLPPETVFTHAGAASGYTLDTKGKWFLGLPDEVSTSPQMLRLDSSKAANVAGGSTDKRNHVTYYSLDEAGTNLAADTVSDPYPYVSNADNYMPLSLRNYAIPIIRPSEFIGGKGGGILKPGKRIVIAKEFYRTASASQRSTVNMRVSLNFGTITNFASQPGMSTSATSERPFGVAMAPFWDSLSIPLQEISSSNYDSDNLSGIKSMQINDPKLGYEPKQWKWLDQTFGQENANSDVGSAPSLATAREDLDEQGNVSEHGVWWMPTPAASGGTDSRITSLGALGAIHTGMAKTASAMVPWRTLRLQPNRTGDTCTLPDWMLLEAFAVPPVDYSTTKHSGLIGPHGLAFGGLVNLNSAIFPMGLTSEQRTTGVGGLLAGAHKNATEKLSASEALDIAGNISRRQLADGGYSGKLYGTQDILETPAKVIECKGVADRGEESEETVRDILALATVRSNVFMVYAVGQALKQTRDGKLVMTAESRRQVMLERAEQVSDPTSTPISTTIKIRSLYSRDLHP